MASGSSRAGGVTASSVPIDAVFYGTAVGTAYNASTGSGYLVPANDRYAGGAMFGTAGNTHLFADPGGGAGAFARLTGTYDTVSGTWTTGRTLSVVQGPASADGISTAITVVPEIPSGLPGPSASWNPGREGRMVPGPNAASVEARDHTRSGSANSGRPCR